MAAYHCCVPFCKSDSRYNAEKKISFHRIPAFHVEPQRHRDWLTRIRREPGPSFKVSSCTRVCSKHFLPSDFMQTLTGKRNLKPYSVPCIFQWTTDELTEEQMSTPKRNMSIGKNTLQPILPSQVQVQNSKPSHPAEMTASILDHCYDLPPMTDKQMLNAAREEISRLQERNAALEKNMFFLERFSADSSLITFYTGFKDYATLKVVFSTLTESDDCAAKWKQCQEEANLSVKKDSATETLPQIDQFFLFLCKVRQGFHDEDLAVRFNITPSGVARMVIEWAHYLYLVLGEIPLWRSRESDCQDVPDCFKASYPRARVTLHCAEIKVQSNSTDSVTSQIYSTHVTYKGLLGIAPHGAVIFISPLYTGCASKREITKSSGILELLEPDDWVITDKDFLIQDLVESVGGFVIVPPIITTAALPRECHEATVMFAQPSPHQNTMFILASSAEDGQETLVVTSTGVEDAVVELEQSPRQENKIEVISEEKVVEEVVTTTESMEVSEDHQHVKTESKEITKSLQSDDDMKGSHYSREEVVSSSPHAETSEESSGLNKDINSLARLRICINQDIERVRQYHLFDNVLPWALAGVATPLWAVCAMLTNINGSLS